MKYNKDTRHNVLSKFQKHIPYICIFLFIHLNILLAFSQNNNYNTNIEQNLTNETIKYTFNWEELSFISEIHSSWDTNSQNIYDMQNVTLQHINTILPLLITKVVDTIPFSNSTSLLQFTHQYELQLSYLNSMIENTTQIEYIPSQDLFGLTVLYKTNMSQLFLTTILNKLSQINIPSRTALSGVVENNYSSLVFSLENKIQFIQDTNNLLYFTPKLLPKVFAKDGTLVYSPEYYQNDTFTYINKTKQKTRPFKYIYENNAVISELGKTPLIVVPLYVNATKWGDIIVSDEYADRILGSNILRNHMKNGNVFFIIPETKPYNIVLDTKE